MEKCRGSPVNCLDSTMDNGEIAQLREQLKSARSVPEKALAVLIDAMERVVSHLESERESRAGMRETIIRFERMVCGWNDIDGKRHAGLIDSVDKMEESNERGRKQSEANAATLKKIFIIVVSGGLTALVLYVAGKIQIHL